MVFSGLGFQITLTGMHKLARLLTPTWLTAIGYFFISIYFLFITRFTSFITIFVGNTEGTTLLSIFRENISNLSTTLSNFDFSAPIVLAGFWGMVGFIVYIGGVVLHNVFVEAENDLVVGARFVHPRHFDSSNYWVYVLVHVLFRIAATVLLAGYIIAAIQFLAPLWLQLFEVFLFNAQTVGGWVDGIVALLGMVITLHVGVVLLRLAVMRDRLFERQ